MPLKPTTQKLVLTVLLSSALLAGAAGAWASKPANFQEALAQAKAENKMLLIDFYTDW